MYNKMGEKSNASSTSSLALPSIPGASPDGGASPRRAVSPLLEVRRPHCTLNCDHCSGYLEDLYRNSMFFFMNFLKREKIGMGGSRMLVKICSKNACFSQS